MKIIHFTASFLIFFLFLIVSSSNYKLRSFFRKPIESVIKHLKLTISSVSLAKLFTKLGSKKPYILLAMRIQKRCKNESLLKTWIRIIKYYRKDIEIMTKKPFSNKKYWYIYHSKRKKILRMFLKSFVKCGYVHGAKNVIGKIIQSYASYYNPYVLVSFILLLKKIFYRKRTIITQRQNDTIYPFHVIKKLDRLKKFKRYCKKYKNHCLFYRFNCVRKRRYCRYVETVKERVIHEVRKVFSYYFSKVFSFVIKNGKMKKSKRSLFARLSSLYYFKSPK
jgi:hypothetical protein